MVEQAERLWTFDAVEPGQYGAETVVTITADNIAGYAEVALNDDPRYRGPLSLSKGASLAMPTMVLAYAPLLREEIAEANGFTALEQSKTARRQTPFAKCDIRWRQPVCAGDVITGRRGTLEKYERRGSRFVTFRVEGVNQRGETAVEYDYTCIFDYARGQREVPSGSSAGTAHPHPNPPPEGEGNEVAATPDGEVGPSTSSGQGASRRLLDFDSAVEGMGAGGAEHHREPGHYQQPQRLPAGGTAQREQHPHRRGVRAAEHLRRHGQLRPGHHVIRGPDAATVLPARGLLQRREPADAGHHALPQRGHRDLRGGSDGAQAQFTDSSPHDGRIDGGIVECRVRGTNQRGELVCLADAIAERWARRAPRLGGESPSFQAKLPAPAIAPR